MQERHWTDDELIERLCGVASEDAHLAECADCARRWQLLREKRQSLFGAPLHVSDAFLARQRRSIQERIEGAKWRPLRLAPALAAALLLAFVLLTMRPTPPEPPREVASEEELLEDVYMLVATPEPYAIEPVQQIFEVSQ
jgi:hypothetical protein